MALPSQALPVAGQPNSTEDPKVRSALQEIQTILAGLDLTNITTGLLLELAVAGSRRRVAFGAIGSQAWANGSLNTYTITHGLGTTPIAVLCSNGRQAEAATGATRMPLVAATGGYTSTTFAVTFRTFDSTVIGSLGSFDIQAFWVAIG